VFCLLLLFAQPPSVLSDAIALGFVSYSYCSELLGLLALTITAGVVAVTAMNARPARGDFSIGSC
jgi:hypothetical protein